MNKTGKYLYCPKCKRYPNKMDEIYDNFIEFRVWNKKMDCYELINSNRDNPNKTVCNKCETELIEK